jgi:hypothetical protein
MTKIATDFAIASDVLKYESAQHNMWGRNRKQGVYNGAAGTLEIGRVLSKVAGKLVPFNEDGADGSQTPVAIVIEKTVAAAATDTPVLVLGDLPYQVDCGVLSTGLIWSATATSGEIATATAVLESKGFQIITGVTDAVV